MPWFPLIPKVYAEPGQMSKIKLFTEIVNGSNRLFTLTKSSILDVWQGPEYVAVQRVTLKTVCLKNSEE